MLVENAKPVRIKPTASRLYEGHWVIAIQSQACSTLWSVLMKNRFAVADGDGAWMVVDSAEVIKSGGGVSSSA